MCGIAGIIGLARVNPRAVEAMTERLVHRGPDPNPSTCAPPYSVVALRALPRGLLRGARPPPPVATSPVQGEAGTPRPQAIAL